MDLLTTTGVALRSRGRALRLGLALSAAVHVLLAALLLALPARAVTRDVPIEIAVDVVAEPAPPPSAAPSAPTVLHPPAEARVRPSRRLSPQPPAAELESLPAAPAAVAEDAPSPEAPAAPAVSDNPDGPAVTTAVAPAGLRGGGSSAGPSGPTVPSGGRSGAGPGGAVQHRATVDRYRTEGLGSRIREVFRYPSDARDLELAGRVLLSVAIARDGRLLEVRLAGRCPHAILCADGLRTIRAAAPFPPLPPALGDSIVVEVPLTYAFDAAGPVDLLN